MKSDKVHPAAKMAPRPTPPVAKTDLPVGNEEIACVGSCEKSTKSAYGEVGEICALLKPDLFEDMGVCAKFVDGVRGVVCLSSFAKHTTKYRKTALLTMMQKTTILAAKSMLIDQKDTKEEAKAMADEAYSSVEKIKRLESELVALKGSNISAPTSLQLETAHQEIVDLKTRLDVIQAEATKGKAPDGATVENVAAIECVATK
ncbi:hypothetical protein ACFX1X_012824 [Malus domestica]